MFGSIPLPVGSGHRNGYLARPDEAGRFPVVIVVPGLSGMGSFEKDLCRRLARHGFAALTIDLYRQEGDPLESYNALPDERALADLDELHEFVVSTDVEWNLSTTVGLVGSDVGGRFALAKGATRDWVQSVIVAYTPLAGDEERAFQVASYLSHLPIPVMGLYGTADELIDTASVDEAQRRNGHGQWLLYDGAVHGFLDVTAEGFDPSASDDAFARILAFFQATLGQPEIEDLG